MLVSVFMLIVAALSVRPTDRSFVRWTSFRTTVGI